LEPHIGSIVLSTSAVSTRREAHQRPRGGLEKREASNIRTK
jgi:hypothetical protein